MNYYRKERDKRKPNFDSYWDLIDRSKTYVENLHDYLALCKYERGKDYLEIDLGEYIAFCPFNYYILGCFLRGCLRHCVTFELGYWTDYFKTNFYFCGNLKTFFLKKSTMVDGHMSDDSHWEFTCWINVTTAYIHKYSCDGDNFYNFHDYENNVSTDTIEYARPIIENNYDKIVNEFINSVVYKKLKPEITISKKN
jgi:hypothetical protein